MDSRRLGTITLAAVLPAALTVTLWAGSPADAQPAVTKTTAKALLARLPVAAERDSYTGFPGGLETWAKSTVRKCRTVYDQVIAEEALDPAPNACVTFNRIWKDPWLGNRTQSSSAMTTVRLVFPGEAWDSGAWTWDARTQGAFANDVNFVRTLAAVTKKAADARQDREPGAWLPSKKALRCAYVTDWIAVKYRWRLSVDDAEKQALSRALAACKAVKFVTPKRARVTTAG